MPIALTVSLVNAALVAVLLNAVIAKAVNPEQLSRALQELIPILQQRRVGGFPGRATSVVEMMAALALTTSPTRQLGAMMIATLGVAFIAIGVLGLLRGASLPCGCMGDAAQGHPFGTRSIEAGLLMSAAALANLSGSFPVLPSVSYLVWTTVLAAALSIAVVLWLHRPLFRLLSVSDASPVSTSKENATW